VLRAYMTQMSIELENIINIIESVRYGLPVDEMRRMLVL
jgi:vacuolar-type H+-ATPase subunit C/Vma6